MNNTPTTRTDEIIEQSWRSINFPNSPIPAKFARQLETELATVTEQLTAAREELADWHNAAQQVKAEYPDEVHCSCVAILRKQLKDVTEQRDRLAEALTDMLSGWRYIRKTHGDLYGVGWDRAQTKARQALQSLNQTTP